MPDSHATVRELIKEIQLEVRDGEVSPMRAAINLARLASLYGNVLEETREAEFDFNGVLLDAYGREETVNRAKLIAQASPEYVRLREAQDCGKVVQEIARALKAVLRYAEEEARLSR